MSLQRKVTAVDAQDVMEQVRQQLRRDSLIPIRHSAVHLYSGPPRIWRAAGSKVNSDRIPGDSEELAERLGALYQSLDSTFTAGTAGIGELPPAMPTLRGRAGRATIQVLQRLLWWYTRSVQGFAESVGTHLRDSTQAIETLAYMYEAQRMEIAALRDEIRLLRDNSAARPGNGQ